jgi:hypothetical protein
LRILVVAGVCLALTLTWVDPDLWGHVLFGRDILRVGLSSADPYSFTSDVRWVNHEWLAEIALYASYAAAKGAGLVLFKAAVIVAAVALAHARVRRSDVDPIVSDALLVVLAAGVWVRSYVARPQIFSLLFFAAMLWILRRVEDGRRGWLAALPVTFALWVNFHGGWVVGIGVLALWAAITYRRRSQGPCGSSWHAPPRRPPRSATRMARACGGFSWKRCVRNGHTSTTGVRCSRRRPCSPYGCPSRSPPPTRFSDDAGEYPGHTLPS